MRYALFALLSLVVTSTYAQTAGDYFIWQWNGTHFVKVYTTTFPPATHNHDASYQPLDLDLTNLAGVTNTPFGRSLLASANAAYARGLLELSNNHSPTFFGLTIFENGNDYPVFSIGSAYGSVNLSIENVTDARTLYLPDVNGVLLTEDGNGASLTALNASSIASGSLALARIAQGGATSGQALVWNGSAWAPGSVSAPVTSVAGMTGAVVLNTSHISGLGTMATQNANNVTITGGSITGASVVSLGGTSNTFWMGDANTVLIANTSVAARYAGTERLWVQGGVGFATSYASNLQAYLILRGANSLGMGLASATPAEQYLGGQDATGTNIAGGAFYVRGGNGTGTGGSGSIIFQTAPTGSSGSAANTMTTRLEITKEGYIKFSGLPTSSAGLPSGVLWNNANTINVVP